jgi:glycosyltransferase involved in cell wall biosynthesis
VRIAQVAPLFESVPPRRYGGTERVVSYLTEELVRQGHRVTLFATADSETSAELVPIVERPLRGDPLWMFQAVVQVEKVFRRAGDFDVLHFHTDGLHYPLIRKATTPVVTTLHGRQDLPGLARFYRVFSHVPVVSISDAQRAPLPHARWVGTVHHGLPPTLYRPGSGRGGYLAFLGRISPEKRVDRAVEIARRAGVQLLIAAKVDPVDRTYFEREIEPLLHAPGVEYLGEIGDEEKVDFLGDALAVIFPIDWPEPFGLVMIEAMACGTPVLAFHGGSVEEIIRPGVTGAVVGSVDEAVEALPSVATLDRVACRQEFERRFSAARMAQGYVRVYEQLMGGAEREADEAGWGAGLASHG